eukprot:15467443-Alexandrium_andersonii.AAC.1
MEPEKDISKRAGQTCLQSLDVSSGQVRYRLRAERAQSLLSGLNFDPWHLRRRLKRGLWFSGKADFVR